MRKINGKPRGTRMAERAPIGRPYGGSGKRAACLRPSVGAAIGRQPKAKSAESHPEAHRAERAPIGEATSGSGKRAACLRPSVRRPSAANSKIASLESHRNAQGQNRRPLGAYDAPGSKSRTDWAFAGGQRPPAKPTARPQKAMQNAGQDRTGAH